MENWKPCPLCGKLDRLDFTQQDTYERLRDTHGSACVTVECRRCNLELRDHTSEISEYEDRMVLLRNNWNHLPRRGDEMSREDREKMVIEKVRYVLNALEEGA